MASSCAYSISVNMTSLEITAKIKYDDDSSLIERSKLERLFPRLIRNKNLLTLVLNN